MGVLTDERLAELRTANVSVGGNRLDLALRLSRLTQKHVAKSLKIAQPLLSKLKTGKQRTLSLETATKLADYFGCTPDDLFPPAAVVRELPKLADLGRPLEPIRRGARPKRPRRSPRKRLEVVYPLPAHLEKQRLSLIEMLIDVRLAKGSTLQDVADRLDRTRQQIEQWESAARSIRIDTFMEWADALGYRLCLEPITVEQNIVAC